jgi:hypothetical protein
MSDNNAPFTKSFVGQTHGWLNDLSGQLAELHAAISAPVDPRQQHPMPSGTQPGENIDGATGAMVVDTPSASEGIARMVPGVGNRSAP